jgi:proliferating cell nuclear antigen
MSQAESQNGGTDAENGENDSGIVITNGTDGVGADAAAEPEAEPEAEVESEPEAEQDAGVEDEAEPEADVVDEADTEAAASVDEEAETEPEAEGAAVEGEAAEVSDEDAEAEADVDAETEAEAEVDTAAEEGAEDIEDEEGATETDTEVEPEQEAEAEQVNDTETEVSAEPEAEQAVKAEEDEEAADASETNENTESNMSESETQATSESAETETGSQELSEITGAPAQFEATIKAGTLQGLIDSVDVLVDECKVRLGDERVSIRAVDPANVGMVDVDLEAQAFESYHTSPGLLGMNLNKFADVVSLGDKDDLVHLNYDAQTRKLHISVGGIEYTLALIDPDSIRQEPDIPDLNLNVEATVDSSVVDQGVTASDMVSDHIALGTEQDGHQDQLVIEAEGDTDDVELVVKQDDDEFIEGTFNGEAHSLFSLDYLKDMNKALPKNAEVTLEIGDEYPIKLHFDDEDGVMHTTYMLAPRIQSD